MSRFSGIDARLEPAQNWYEAAAAIKSADEDEGDARAAIIAALEYHFPTPDSAEAPFGPKWQIEGQVYPMPIAVFPEAGVDAWREALDEISNHLVRSRLADLLWIRKIEDAYRYARMASFEYVEVARSVDQPLVIADATCRALELAIEINDTTQAISVIDTAFVHMDRMIDSDEWIPGASLRIARRLVDLPQRYSASERVAEALERSLVRYQDDPHVVSGIRELQISLFRNDPEKVKEIAKTQVQEWIQIAEAHSGLLRLVDLEKARDIASAAGLSEELVRIRQMIERSPLGENDLQTVSASVSIPTEHIEEFESGFFPTDGTARSFLLAFGSHCPFPLEHNQIVESAREQLQEFPLQHLFSNVVLNQEGLPLARVNTPEGHLEHAIRSELSARCGIWLLLAGNILDKSFEMYPDILDNIKEHFCTEFISPELADVVARAFTHYREQRFDDCLCVLTPRLEAIVREMARKLGINIYKEPTASRPGSYRLLGSLLDEFKGKMPNNYHRYIVFTLSDQLGLNVRNRLCHGLMLAGTRQEATLVLHLVSLLATFTGLSSDEPLDPDSE